MERVAGTFGRYRIVGELGRGATGTVYRAIDPAIDREIAIKTLASDMPEELRHEIRERFLREARSAGRLNHPNIVTVFDVGERDGVAFIAMEFLGGRSLQQILKSGEVLSPALAAHIGAQIAEALDHAHQRSIVHRDVKPANVMVDAAWHCKLTDFGVAHVPSSAMTQVGTILGSPRYMSPEHVQGLPADPRSDIFSLGVILYEMLTGRTPFERPDDVNVYALLERIALEPHLAARNVNSQVPAEFEAIVERALAKNPTARYQRAADVAQDLRALAPAGHPRTEDDARTVRLAARLKPAADLVQDIDSFERQFERDEQVRRRAMEEERRLLAQEIRRQDEQAMLQRARPAMPAESPAEHDAPRRRSALDILRERAATQASRPDHRASWLKSIQALDQSLRAAMRYFSELAAEINALGPTADDAYEYLFLGPLASVVLLDAWTDSRPRAIEGRDYCNELVFRYRIRPREFREFVLLREEIARCEDYLKRTKTEYQMHSVTKNDFGQPARAVFRITGGLRCDVRCDADYEKLAVRVELRNVRRVGTFSYWVGMDDFESLPDDIGRYVLGVDKELETRSRRWPHAG